MLVCWTMEKHQLIHLPLEILIPVRTMCRMHLDSGLPHTEHVTRCVPVLTGKATTHQLAETQHTDHAM